MTTKKISGKSKKKTSGRRGASTTNVVVLGGGLIGSVIASDLAASRGMRVTVADASADSLKNCVRRADRPIETVEADLVTPARSRRRSRMPIWWSAPCPAASA